MPESGTLERLLLAGFRHRVVAPDAEAALKLVQTLAGAPLDPAAFHAAIAEALARGLIHEPVRLPEGSLHCHWHLQLTSAGVVAARALIAQE